MSNKICVEQILKIIYIIICIFWIFLENKAEKGTKLVSLWFLYRWFLYGFFIDGFFMVVFITSFFIDGFFIIGFFMVSLLLYFVVSS